MTVILQEIARRIVVTSLTALMSLIGMAFGSALAQDAPKPAAAGAVTIDGWMKICGNDERQKKEICKTGYDLRSEGGQFLASISVSEMAGEARKIVELIMPTGLLLQPGVKVQVDQNKAEDGKFSLCMPEACVAGFVTTDAFLGSLKKGSTLTVTAQGQAANPISFAFPLASFKSANEGKAIDEATLKKRQEAIAQDIQQKQKSIEEQLRAEQHKATQSP